MIVKNNRSFPDDFINHVIHGDSVEILQAMPENSVELIITSPPYFVNKSYELTLTMEDFYSLMMKSFNEWGRILTPGGYAVVNFGDFFNKDRFYDSNAPSVYPASLKYFEWGRDAGFDLQSTRIWRKQFSRMSIPFVCNHHPRPVFDYEHIWTFRKPNESGKEIVHDRKKSQSAVLGDNWRGSARLGQHEASFPIDLPLWAIDVYTKDKDTVVLDPFCGSGTTLMAAYQKHHGFIGIDKSRGYCNLAYNNLMK